MTICEVSSSSSHALLILGGAPVHAEHLLLLAEHRLEVDKLHRERRSLRRLGLELRTEHSLAIAHSATSSAIAGAALLGEASSSAAAAGAPAKQTLEKASAASAARSSAASAPASAARASLLLAHLELAMELRQLLLQRRHLLARHDHVIVADAARPAQRLELGQLGCMGMGELLTDRIPRLLLEGLSLKPLALPLVLRLDDAELARARFLEVRKLGLSDAILCIELRPAKRCLERRDAPVGRGWRRRRPPLASGRAPSRASCAPARC